MCIDVGPDFDAQTLAFFRAVQFAYYTVNADWVAVVN
jgi:hypothetical protein